MLYLSIIAKQAHLFFPPQGRVCRSRFWRSYTCGVPTITTDVGQITEIISDKENGFLVEGDAWSIKIHYTNLSNQICGPTCQNEHQNPY